MILNERTTLTLPRDISEVLFLGIVVIIKRVTLTYSLTEILIIILSIYVISVVSDKGTKRE